MSISEYLSAALDYKVLPHIVKNAQELLKNIKFDSIAVRGMSGSLVASILAVELKKNIILVRKEKEINSGDSHSSSMVEYSEIPKKYIIVDDFTSSGETVKTIIEQIQEDALECKIKEPKCIGVFLYCQPADDDASYIIDEINSELGLKMSTFSSFI